MNERSAEQEFQPYLDCVTKSGDRTRTVWYVLVLIVATVFFGEWNTRPSGVSTSRFVRMMDALVCVYDPSWKPKEGGPSCREGLDYASIRHHFPNALTGNNGPNEDTKREIRNLLEKRVEDVMRRELATHIITVPIFGVTVDGNDLWFLSGFVVIFVLRILWTCLEREFDNLKRAARQATSNMRRELLIMTQLFFAPKARWHAHLLLLFLPLALYLFALFNLSNTEYIARILDGPRTSVVLTSIQFVLIIPICWLCWTCFSVARRIESLVSQLAGQSAIDPTTP